jgi:homoserine kinase
VNLYIVVQTKLEASMYVMVVGMLDHHEFTAILFLDPKNVCKTVEIRLILDSQHPRRDLHFQMLALSMLVHVFLEPTHVDNTRFSPSPHFSF